MTIQQLALLGTPAICLMSLVIIGVGVWRAYERLFDVVDRERGMK